MVLRHSHILQTFVAIATSLLAIEPVNAQQSPPADSSSQVLFSFDRQSVEASSSNAYGTSETPATAILEDSTTSQLYSESHPPAPLPGTVKQFNSDVAQASYNVNEDESSQPNRRRLAPPSRDIVGLDPGRPNGQSDPLPFSFPNMNSLGTAGAGLALVVGLFLLCVSLVRKGKPNPSTLLPPEAISVLGRIPLAARHFAYLIHVGTKLVLVAVTPDSVQTITEVTEPIEVERLMALCMKSSSRSTSAEFQRMLQQMSKEPARGFLGKG